MRVLTHNIKNTAPDLSPEQVRRAARLCRDEFNFGGFQEIVEPNDYAMLRDGLGKDYQVSDRVDPRQECFLAVKSERGSINRTGYVETNPHVRPGGPGRPLGFTWADSVFDGERLTGVSTHMMNKAYRSTARDQGERRKHWDRHWKIMGEFVGEVVKRGGNVVLFGDFNRHMIPVWSPNMKWVVNPRMGIDKIAVIVAPGYRCRITGPAFSIDTPSDHMARGRQIQIERKRDNETPQP